MLSCSSMDFWSHWPGERTPQDDLDRFAVDGGLEQFQYLKTQMGGRPQEERMAFTKYIHEIKRARGESLTSWINRSDEALMDMRKKLASALGANSSESTMIPPQIQGWLLLHRATLRYQDIVVHDHDWRQLEHRTCRKISSRFVHRCPSVS